MHDYNKETYVICFWMYVSDWSALFYLVEVVQQAPGHPTLPGLHSLGVCAGVQRHTAHGGTHLEALELLDLEFQIVVQAFYQSGLAL